MTIEQDAKSLELEHIEALRVFKGLLERNFDVPQIAEILGQCGSLLVDYAAAHAKAVKMSKDTSNVMN